jgi:hypothetical protein
MKPYSDARHRHILPLNSGAPVMPHVLTRIVGRPKQGALMLTHFIISNAGTEGGAQDWVINDIEVDGISQLKMKNLSGALFSTGRSLIAGSKHASAILHFQGLDVIEQESEASVTVTYVGSNPLGCPFFGAITGDDPPQRPTVLPITTKKTLLPTVTTTITAVLDRSLEIGMLEIENTGTDGGAADWIVNDIRIDGTTQFKQSGDIPGDMFATGAVDSFVKFHPGTRIELSVTYIGLNEGGCCFTARILGTVVRDDLLQRPPPDVHAIIRTSEGCGMSRSRGNYYAAPEGSIDEEVIARCNWRPPYVPTGQVQL